MKAQRKINALLKRRRQQFAVMKAKPDSGYMKPGSQNKHKSFPAGRRRKSR